MLSSRLFQISLLSDKREMSAILSHPFFKNFDELPLGIK